MENLYQAWDGLPEYEETTNMIKRRIQEIEKEMKNLPPPDPITLKEMKDVAKQLKRNKACGPDDIPNEIFIEANDKALEAYMRIFNH